MWSAAVQCARDQLICGAWVIAGWRRDLSYAKRISGSRLDNGADVWRLRGCAGAAPQRPRLFFATAGPDGDLRRRLEADAARPAAALRQARREREEPQAQRAARRARVQPGGHLRQERAARHPARQAAAGVQLPLGGHPRAHRAGRAHRALPVLQGLQAPHPRLDRHLGSWHRHRACQHCHQLRHARGVGHLLAPRWPCRPLRHQGPRHHLRLQRRGRQDPRGRAVAFRGVHHAAARVDRRQLLHDGLGLARLSEERKWSWFSAVEVHTLVVVLVLTVELL
mmetsp:Transcript_2906/g.7283  ORF Transcript_2906/g.7283 Transcript_2906/m.7283 type:complete len:281 (+) Transcript_2906:390-1232(+)